MKHPVDTSQWGEFVVGELFDNIYSVRQVSSQRNIIDESNGIPFVVQTQTNNMVKCYASKNTFNEHNVPIIKGNSIAMGVDLGLNYYEPDYDWSVSIALKNLGGQLKAFDDEYEKMPLDVQLGVTKRFTNTPFRASLTLFDLNHWDYKFIQHVNAGLDVILSDNIWVGAGYNFKRANQMKLFTNDTSSAHGAGLSLGAGLNLERFKLNLAYGKYHVSGSSLLINVGYSL